MANGGYRPGSGAKKRDREVVRLLAVKSIVEAYGSEEAGFKALLQSGEATLIKFVFEHAYGKPVEQVDVAGDLSVVWQEQKTYEAKPETDSSD